MSFYRAYGKRLFDISVSLVAALIMLPLLAILYLLTRITLGNPVFFKQARPGLHGKTFTITKFRTMREIHDANGQLLPDEARMTLIGSIIRKLSLDELPELFNVLKGNMSLVGPRPLLVEYLAHYTPEQAKRHHVKPGITGWAQVNGRNALSWEEKFAYDVWYVEHMSFLLDLKILAMTIWVIFARQGIHAEGHATMPKFGEKEGQ